MSNHSTSQETVSPRWWSDDCSHCLCNFPHTFQAHMQAVEQAHAEIQAELEELRRLNADVENDDLECVDPFSDESNVFLSTTRKEYP